MSRTGLRSGLGRKPKGRPMLRRGPGNGGVGCRIRVSLLLDPRVYEALNRLKVDMLVSGSGTASYSAVISESVLRMARIRDRAVGVDGEPDTGDAGAEAGDVGADTGAASHAT